MRIANFPRRRKETTISPTLLREAEIQNTVIAAVIMSILRQSASESLIISAIWSPSPRAEIAKQAMSICFLRTL